MLRYGEMVCTSLYHSTPSDLTTGAGDALFSTTSRVSLGEFLGHVLTHQPRTRLQELASQSPLRTNRLRLEAARISYNNLLALIQSRYKGDITVDRSISTEELVR